MLPLGLLPVMIAGTARPVKSATVVLFGYQVDCWASAAKWGKRRASIRPRRSSSVAVGNSSKITSTTGVFEGTRTPRALALLCGRISFEVSLKKKKMTRKTTGATESTSSRLGTNRVLSRP